MPFTLIGITLGMVVFIFGMKKEQRAAKVAGLIIIAFVVLYWILFLVHETS